MKAHESAEDYLEMILVLQRQQGAVRSVDIARELNFSKPSISVAMKKLSEDGLIGFDEKKCIFLTETGEKIAETIYERHVLISDFLRKIGVDETTAVREACKIEHVISQDTFEKLKKALQ